MTTRFSRRTFLAGTAAAGILAPFIRPVRRAHAADPSKVKAMFVYVPDGCVPSLFHPTGSETSFSLPAMTKSLTPIIPHLTFIRGLNMFEGGATHEGGIRKVLTGVGEQSLDVALGETL